MKRNLFVCHCGSIEHQLVVTYFPEDGVDAPVAYLEMHLAPLPLWQRLRYAWAYLRGRRPHDGAFAEIVLDAGTALQLGDLLVRHASGI
jgi:hypothetical protein